MNATAFGKYTLVKKLGSGSTGSVWLAHDSHHARNVALKLLHAALISDPDAVCRFQAEARTTSLIRDEHIAQVLDTGTGPDGTPYIAMELLDGIPLSQRTGRPLGTSVAVPILQQICAAMQVAHQHGVVHRDLKPEHIFICPRPGEPNFVKVLDFGIAKVVTSDTSGARPSSRPVWGTPQYMAPEQCGLGPVDCRTDLYAIGVIAYELVTGRVPFDGTNLVEVMVRQRDEKPMPPYEYEPSVPETLSEIILRALSKRPEERFTTAAEMAEALSRVRTRDGRIPELRAGVRLRGGRPLLEAHCTQLMSGGAFLATPDAPPQLGEALSVTLYCDSFPIEVPCEVSMHVGREQSVSWGTPPGFAVRFSALDAKVQGLIERVLRGDPMPRHAADPELTRLTKDHRRANGMEDYYALLALPTGADRLAIKRRTRECRAKLEDALLVAPSGHAHLNRAIERVERATRVLLDPAQRLDYDAARGNFRGVAACLDSGLARGELHALRKRYALVNPTALAAARGHVAAAVRHEASGRMGEALAESELALTLDPLDCELHAQRSRLMALAAAKGLSSSSDEWPAVNVQRQVIGGTPASAAKTPPSERRESQLSPELAPAMG